MVFEASFSTAMLMVLSPTPRTEEEPPGPGSQILPTPGQTPLELDALVAAPAVVYVSATDAPANITVANASGSADFRSWFNPLQIITPSPCDRIIQASPQPKQGARHRLGETEPKCSARIFGTSPRCPRDGGLPRSPMVNCLSYPDQVPCLPATRQARVLGWSCHVLASAPLGFR